MIQGDSIEPIRNMAAKMPIISITGPRFSGDTTRGAKDFSPLHRL
jgi:hypothetical protein